MMMKLPEWKEIPDIELYSDQLVSYVNRFLNVGVERPFSELSASMVNNYVKHHYLEKPIKKKYTKNQVARLLLLTLLKTVFSIQDISALIEFCIKTTTMQSLYSHFVSYWNEGITLGEMNPVLIAYADAVKAYRQANDIYNQYIKKEERHAQKEYEVKRKT